jgi:shikimate kinase
VNSPTPERVVLVGFMGSGKSTVGKLLAEALGWRFVDQDALVEEQEGLSISEMFAGAGESHFRAVEAPVADRLLREKRIVMASGGGWAALPDRIAGLPNDTVCVWLRVSAEEAVRRTEEAAGSRPLLSGPDTLETALRLLEQRTPFYSQSDLEVDTEALRPEDVSARILKFLVDRHPAMDAKRLRSLNAQ